MTNELATLETTGTTKAEAIQKLNAKYERYDLGVENVGSPAGTFTAKAVLQILQDSEKGPIVVRRSSAYGFGTNLKDAQDDAIVSAIENLGL